MAKHFVHQADVGLSAIPATKTENEASFVVLHTVIDYPSKPFRKICELKNNINITLCLFLVWIASLLTFSKDLMGRLLLPSITAMQVQYRPFTW